jgi:hypothetical protein
MGGVPRAREDVTIAQPANVTPFPVDKIGTTLVKKLSGPRDIAGLPLMVRQHDAVVIQGDLALFPLSFLGLPSHDRRSLLLPRFGKSSLRLAPLREDAGGADERDQH